MTYMKETPMNYIASSYCSKIS